MAEMAEVAALRLQNEALKVEIARLKATRAAVVNACKAGKITLVREAMKLSELSEEPDGDIKDSRDCVRQPLGFHADTDDSVEMKL